MTCLACEYNASHCSGYFCPYRFWRASVMLSTVLWDWKRPDWLTAGPAVCSHWQLYRLHLCSIILSAEVHHKLCQQMQYSTPLTVIGLPRRESPDLIRKGTWPLTTTPSLLLLSFSSFELHCDTWVKWFLCHFLRCAGTTSPLPCSSNGSSSSVTLVSAGLQ